VALLVPTTACALSLRKAPYFVAAVVLMHYNRLETPTRLNLCLQSSQLLEHQGEQLLLQNA
jgi:hypothetical protein